MRCEICNRRSENVGPRRGFDYSDSVCGGCCDLDEPARRPEGKGDGEFSCISCGGILYKMESEIEGHCQDCVEQCYLCCTLVLCDDGKLTKTVLPLPPPKAVMRRDLLKGWGESGPDRRTGRLKDWYPTNAKIELCPLCAKQFARCIAAEEKRKARTSNAGNGGEPAAKKRKRRAGK
jgi:hypothetical protein